MSRLKVVPLYLILYLHYLYSNLKVALLYIMSADLTGAEYLSNAISFSLRLNMIYTKIREHLFRSEPNSSFLSALRAHICEPAGASPYK